ncbi:NAD dependent epimerase/dehydratase family protein [Asticcacaulis biprosthecium C19]|uniref:NAD dependent epimerase/dehydratase family protein n=1 Tax=Asticcacaulis biprosthecium C19 TaxID=715226 RepID=F4QT87_9CAUL|nr:NAD dependent epimerase/dehydratase family protein [Asticcacaulis biprosthecium C19]
MSHVADQAVDVLIHLATVPGGTAEADRDLSRRINLNASLDLFDAVAAAGPAADRVPRIIYASTIAIFSLGLNERIDDDTPPAPFLSYAAHKLMCETYLADLHRRGEVEAISLRLPAILARPNGQGLTSAFMSEIFRAPVDRPFVCPTSEDARIWAMSVDQACINLQHAIHMPVGLLPNSRAVTLPVLRFSMGELATALGTNIRFEPDPLIGQNFTSQPILDASAAEAAGFRNDGNLQSLILRVQARFPALNDEVLNTVARQQVGAVLG